MGKHSQLRTLRTPVEGESRTLCGQEYIVISVVALIEGVRHAGGSPNPEYVPASAFGRHVETWNGRPIVVNHPVNAKGQAVLASSDDILETSYLGRMMNARIEDDRMVCDAYLDVAAITSSESDGVADMWKRLVAGETIEVSVGAIVYTREGEGTHDGKKYDGIWDIVIPDHLAFLDGGQIGACSVEDGCGTFRTQSAGMVVLSTGARERLRSLYSPSQPRGKDGKWIDAGYVLDKKSIGRTLTEQDHREIDALVDNVQSGADVDEAEEFTKDCQGSAVSVGNFLKGGELMMEKHALTLKQSGPAALESFRNGTLYMGDKGLMGPAINDGDPQIDCPAMSTSKRATKASTKMSKGKGSTGGVVKTSGGAVLETACGCKSEDQPKGLVTGQSDDEVARVGGVWARMLWGGDTFDMDKRKLLQKALMEQHGPDCGYVVTFNDSEVITESYHQGGYATHSISYSVTKDGVITFAEDHVEVVLQTKAVPVKSKSKGKDKHMSAALSKLAAKAKGRTFEEDDDEDDAEGDSDPKGGKGGKKKKMHAGYDVPVHVLDLAVALDSAETLDDVSKALNGTSIGRTLASAIKVCADARDHAIKKILSTTGGKAFTAETLATVEFDVLSKMAVSFLAADAKAAEAAAAAEEEEEDEGEGDDEGMDEDDVGVDADVAATTLSSVLDFNGRAQALNRPVAKKTVPVAQKKNGASVAKLSKGGGNFGGRAAQGATQSSGIPAPQDAFAFDASGTFIPHGAQAKK